MKILVVMRENRNRDEIDIVDVARNENSTIEKGFRGCASGVNVNLYHDKATFSKEQCLQELFHQSFTKIPHILLQFYTLCI